MSRPRMIIETSERCICLNENCGNREIPRSNVAMKIAPTTGIQTVRALCPDCLTLYIVTRKPKYGVWGLPTIETVIDRDKVDAFKRMLGSIGEIQRKDLPPVKVAV